MSSKTRKDQSLRTLMFCSESLCSSTFDAVEQFEKHVAENTNSFSKTVSHG